MQQGHAAWRHEREALTFRMDMRHEHVAWTYSLYMDHGQTA
jgi:hypothetical protein